MTLLSFKEEAMKALSFVLGLVAFLFFATFAFAFAFEVLPVKYEKVNFSWKSDTLFEGTIKLYMQNNTGEDIRDVAATISSTPANTKVIDGNVSFGDIMAGQTLLSQDSFTVQTDTGNPADPNEGITWEIRYKDQDGKVHVLQAVPEFPAAE